MRNSTLKFCAMLLAICTSTIHLQAMDEWDGVTVAQGFYSGTGTKDNPYRIFTASQFLYFLQQTKDGNTFSGQYVELCNDIAFSHEAIEGGDFYGDFDGNDHTIQVNEYWSSIYDWYGWTLFNLYGSMHDVQFVRAGEVMHIYTGGILYNCRFEFPGGEYHGLGTIYLEGGTIANCVSNSAYFKNKYEMGGSGGLVYYSYGSVYGYCFNCYFPIESYSYGSTLAPNYGGVIESCGEEAGNDWLLSHTEYAYKSWPLTFNPTYPEYQITEQPQSYNPFVVCPNTEEALFQWHYQERKPITFEDIPSSPSTQTMNIVVPDDDVVLSFYFEAHGYRSGRYNDNYHYAWISVNGEEIVHVYDERAGIYSYQASAGTYEISCALTDISDIRITYPIEILADETSSVLSKQTIMEKPGAYFCQVSYGEGCDVMNSDYVDYEKLLTIDNVTYVINEDATATVLWADDMAERVTIHETVSYDDVDYPVTSISSKAFADCSSLESIECKTSEVPALLGGTNFEGLIPSNVTLYTPSSMVNAYKTTAPWSSFGKIADATTILEIITMNLYGSATYCSKRALDFSKVEGLKAYAATGYNTKTGIVTLTRVMTSQPGMGLFLKGEAGEYSVSTLESTDDNSLNMLVGTLEKTTVNSTSNDGKYLNYKYTKLTDDEPLMFHQFKDDSSLSAGKAYLQIPAAWVPTTAKSISLRFDDGEGTTDIEETELTNQNSEIIYDLMGRKVITPQKGMVYIMNGKKTVF